MIFYMFAANLANFAETKSWYGAGLSHKLMIHLFCLLECYSDVVGKHSISCWKR